MITDPRTAILCYSTPNYKPVTDLFLLSLRESGVPDENIFLKTAEPDLSLAKETGFGTPLWYLCIFEKIKHNIEFMRENMNSGKYDYFVCTDCDITFIKRNVHHWNTLRDHMERENKVIYFMREAKSDNDINGGFYIIRNKDLKKTVDFFQSIYDHITTTPYEQLPFADQTVINDRKGELEYGLIPFEFVAWGLNIWNPYMTIIHHAVCTKDTQDKCGQIHTIRHIFGL
jgi:hypothetical protein